MPYHYFTQGGCKVYGFSVKPDGTVVDFSGTLRNFYNDLARASAAARRKYNDSTITITEVTDCKTRYRVDIDALMKIAERTD